MITLKLFVSQLQKSMMTFAKIVDDMFDTMYQEEGIGLAAPQVDILQRIITIDIEGDKQKSISVDQSRNFGF